MAPMRCEEFRQISSEWMEGERNPAAESHLAACPRCSAVLADLEKIRGAAALLPEEEPSSAVWVAIRSQLQQEGLIHAPRPEANVRRWRLLGAFGAFRPALAGAYLCLVIAAAAVLGAHMKTNDRAAQQALWLQSAQSTMTPLAAELNTAETSALPALHGQNSDVTATLNRNLAIVDNMISMCEKSVREDPQNEMTRDYLYAAYQQKADLLAAMAESSER
jgi:hypothetical protein